MNSQHYDVRLMSTDSPTSTDSSTSTDDEERLRLSQRPRSPLNGVLAAALRLTASDPDDSISQLAVAEAIEELIALDPHRPASWRLRGLSEGYGLGETPLPAPTPELDCQRIAGLLEAAVERADDHLVTETVDTAPEPVVALVAAGDLPCVADVLVAVLPNDPARAVDLATAAPEPFPQWETFVGATIDEAEDNEAVRRRLVELLNGWAASSPPATAALRAAADAVSAAIS